MFAFEAVLLATVVILGLGESKRHIKYIIVI